MLLSKHALIILGIALIYSHSLDIINIYGIAKKLLIEKGCALVHPDTQYFHVSFIHWLQWKVL